MQSLLLNYITLSAEIKRRLTITWRNFTKKGDTDMENHAVTKRKYCIEIADIQLTILSDESEEFVRDTVKILDTQIRDLTVQNKRCAKIDAAILCALDSLGEKIKLEKKLRNLQAQIDLYEANLRRLRTETGAAPSTPVQAEEKAAEAAVPAETEKAEEKPEKPEKAEKPKKAEDKPAPKAKKPAAKPAAVQQLSVEENTETPKAEEPAADAPKGGVRDDKLKQIESLLRRRSEASPEETTADGTNGSHDDKLRQIEELLRVGGGRSLTEALQDARES